jgi:hypothetical protein
MDMIEEASKFNLSPGSRSANKAFRGPETLEKWLF